MSNYPTGVTVTAEFIPLGPDAATGLYGSSVGIKARGVQPPDRRAVIAEALRDAYERLGPSADTEYGVVIEVKATGDAVKVAVAKVNR